MNLAMQTYRSPGAVVRETAPSRAGIAQCWRLEIPPGPAGEYRCAQLHDYLPQKSRRQFSWRAPLRLELRARVSAPDLPGTWGFGLWNDPFTASLGIRGMARRLPALPNTAWFFFAGKPNYLAFRDTHPAQGFLAATFSSPALSVLLLAPGLLTAPLLWLRPAARLLRRIASLWIAEDAAVTPVDPTTWHTYRLHWESQRVSFEVDGIPVLNTPVTPRGPLGLVIWIDNQYAAFPPSGQIAMGASAHAGPAWLEIEDLSVSSRW